jgi:hypothetical protein
MAAFVETAVDASNRTTEALEVLVTTACSSAYYVGSRPVAGCALPPASRAVAVGVAPRAGRLKEERGRRDSFPRPPA